MRAVAMVLIGTGAVLALLAGAGLLRLPDVFSRMHAATKSASLGIACILAGTAMLTTGRAWAIKAILAIIFQFATSPVAAHAIGRAAYRSGTPLWEGTLHDELREHMDEELEAPASGTEER